MANAYKNKVVYGGQTLIDLSDDTVDAASVLSGRTAHDKSGAPITGSIASQAAATYNVSSNNQTIAAGQYLSGAQTIRGVTTENITAANIKKGVVVKVGDAGNAGRIKNITGTYEGSGSYTLLASGTVTCTTEQASQELLATITATQLASVGNGEMIYVEIRNTATVGAGMWYGSDNWLVRSPTADTFLNESRLTYALNQAGTLSNMTGTYGVYATKSSTSIIIRANYNTTTKATCAGTFTYKVYKLAWASSGPFD